MDASVLEYGDLEKRILQLVLENKKNEAIDLLNQNLVARVINELKQPPNSSWIPLLKNRYRKYYEKLGEPFPEQIEKINTLSDLEKLFWDSKQ